MSNCHTATLRHGNRKGNPVTFGEKLREIREKAEFRQEDLAESSGVPIGSLRGYEQGQREPSWSAVVKIAKALGVTCEAFSDCDDMKGEGEPEKKPAKSPRKKK
jgi:transcriptional regulator with XRE-family HTH domain